MGTRGGHAADVSWLIGPPHSILVAAAKTVLLVSVAVAALRFGQARMLSRLAPFDIITIAAMGAAIGRSATANGTSFGEGAAVVITLAVVHRCISVLRRSPWVRRVLDRRAQTLIRHGRVVPGALRRAGLTPEELDKVLRVGPGQDPEDVWLIQEPTGELTILRGAPGDSGADLWQAELSGRRMRDGQAVSVPGLDVGDSEAQVAMDGAAPSSVTRSIVRRDLPEGSTPPQPGAPTVTADGTSDR
jgi:uncharacterized membrane protein YcaP (DUF421 family)